LIYRTVSTSTAPESSSFKTFADAILIVAKRKMGIYKDDGNGWIKMKNKTYSQTEGRHELMTRQK